MTEPTQPQQEIRPPHEETQQPQSEEQPEEGRVGGSLPAVFPPAGAPSSERHTPGMETTPSSTPPEPTPATAPAPAPAPAPASAPAPTPTPAPASASAALTPAAPAPVPEQRTNMGVVIDSPGHVVFRDLPAPPAQLEKGYYLVEMAAAPINPSDLMYIEGRYPASAPTAPGKLRVGGFEGTGIVRAAGGGDAKHSMVNRPVALWIPEGGTWAHQVVVPAHLVMELPKGVSLGLGSPWVNPLTALALVQKAQNHHDPMTGKSLKPVVVALTAAASSLGRMIIRLAAEKKSNLVILGIVRKAEQCDQLRSLGCEHCFNTTDPAFDDQFRDTAAHLNCTLCYDCVGGSLPGRILRLMPPGATVVVYGSLDPQPTLDGLSPMDLLIHGKRIEGFHLHMFLEAIGKKDTAKLMTTARDKWAGPLATSINKRVPMDQVGTALEEYRRSMSAGKVLLTGPAMPPEELHQPPGAEAPAAQSTAPAPTPAQAPPPPSQQPALAMPAMTPPIHAAAVLPEGAEPPPAPMPPPQTLPRGSADPTLPPKPVSVEVNPTEGLESHGVGSPR